MSEIPRVENESAESESELKIEKYKEMLSDAKAIFILSMSERETNVDGIDKKYRPDSYSDLDNKGFMGGGHANVIAAAELGHYFPDVKLIATSAPEKSEKSLAVIYAEELKKLGIPEEQIKLEEKSTNTLTEIIEMVKIAKNNNWESIAVLTNENQIERASEMFNHLLELANRLNLVDGEFSNAWEYFGKGEKLQVKFLSAEEILPMRDERYKKIIEAMRNSAAYKNRVEAEKIGAQQIREGTYGIK
jgi:hypothetical protein